MIIIVISTIIIIFNFIIFIFISKIQIEESMILH